MEPITTTVIYSTLTWFIGYFIGTDFYNYYKAREEFNELRRRIDDIDRNLNYLKNK
jgi:hypothetical protein